MHRHPAVRNPAHPVLVGGIAFIIGYGLCAGMAAVLLKMASDARRRRYSVMPEKRQGEPVAQLYYDDGQSLLSMHTFRVPPGGTQDEAMAEAHRWADRLAAL